MRVPMLDLKPQLEQLGSELKKAVGEVIDSTVYILGPEVERFEEEVAEYVGVKHAIGVSSGTDALLVSLMALKVGPGDLVITTTYSFFATAGAITRLNATPVFLDIDPDTYNICPQAVDDWFESNPSLRHNVKAIIPVHLYGQCADLDPIIEVATRHGVAVVEDAAQAIGAGYPAAGGLRKAGSFGLMGCFSFFPSKNLGALGDGGLVVTNDDGVAETLFKLRNHGATPKYYHGLVGGNFRLDPIQAVALRVKLTYLEQWHQKRRAVAEHYDASLAQLPIKEPVLAYDRSCHIYNQYVVAVPERRDELAVFLAQAGISTAIYYPVPFHRQECFKDLALDPSDFPHSEYASRHTIALPTYPELTPDMQDYVIEKIRQFYSSEIERG